MTSRTVLPFAEMSAQQQTLAGGKGGMLARLYQAEYPVPDGFVILPAAFSGESLAPEAWSQVRQQIARLRGSDPGLTFAVRSSGLSEDSLQASFAGEFETLLNVGTEEGVREAIHTVRRSGQSQRVQVYSQAKGIVATHQAAVIVQRMVPAALSGVLFTADPVAGSRHHMSGNFIHGLGDKLVSGEASGESFTLQHPGGRYQGPRQFQRFGLKLYKLARRLEREFGSPQDIEWAVSNRKLYLLQSRPITTSIGHNPAAGEWNHSYNGDFFWSNVNFGEAVTGVMTPLSWSVLRLILEEWVFIPGYETVGNIGGRPYLNISVLATILNAVGKGRDDLLETFEGTLYMRLPEETEIPLIALPIRTRLAAMVRSLRVNLKQTQGALALPAYLRTNASWFKQIRQQIQEASSEAELLSLWSEKIKPHVSHAAWIVLGSATGSANYAIQLRRDLTRLVGADDADKLISNLGDDDGALASLGPVIGMAEVSTGKMDRQEYLERFGHRGPDEFELSVPRPVEDPEWLDQQLAQLSRAPANVDALLNKQRAEFNDAWERFQVRYPQKRKGLQRRIRKMGQRARRRERARSEYVRDRWLVRLFSLRAGEMTRLFDDVFFLTFEELLELLSGDNRAVKNIPARKQTYEMQKALPPYPSLIRGRFDPYEWAANPNRRTDLFDASASLPGLAVGKDDANLIQGSAGSSGQVEGTVRLLLDPSEADQFQEGEVLLTMQTDIAWTLLFPRAAAIITDVGAPLSHAAIVARELGIPAVVGCGDATMRLKSGDRVIVDGGQGIVKII